MQISSQINPLSVYQQHTDKASQAQSTTAQQPQTKAAPVENASAKTDSVTFSADAKLLAEANRVASTQDAGRAEKIASLRDQVQNGTYVANEAGIAQGLVREDSALFTF